ncbi:unnamed protein product [Malus baccata var. baccata]
MVNMRNQLPDWKTTIAKSSTTTATTYDGEYSQGFPYENFGVLPIDSVVLDPPTDNSHWNNTSSSISAAAAAGGDDHKHFQEIFQNLSYIQLDPFLQMQQPTPNIFSHDKEVMLCGLSLEKGEFSGKTTTSHEMETKPVMLSGEFKQSKDERPKRSRATELHNMSERMRRNKIRGKLKVLQELIPNCNKWNLNFLHAIRAVVPRVKPNGHMCSTSPCCVDHVGRVENESHIDGRRDLMMSMGGGAVYQTPNLSLAGIQGTQMSQFKPYLPMGPGMGTSNAYEIGMGLGMAMGMINMCYTTGVPTMSVHSATAGLPLMSGPGGLPVNPQVQMQIPFLASQVMPSTTAATSNMVQPRFPTNFSRIFNYANQAGESSSPNTASDNEKVPFINQMMRSMSYYNVGILCLVVFLVVVRETQVGEAAVTCNPMELAPCAAAIMSSNSPTAVCCGKLKEQSPCLCQYVKNPNLQKLVNSPNAKKVADTCGSPFPTC